MIHPRLLVPAAIIAAVAITACSDTTAPERLVPGGSMNTLPRSGNLRVTKECSQYFFNALDYCTITSSNLKEIEVGSRITYLSAASPALYLETDVVLNPPGPGNNVAYGHCSVDLTAINGTKGCVFSGGTGKFRWFHAEVKLSLAAPPSTDLVWNGEYRFSPRD